MTVSLKHAKTSAKADGSNTDLVQPSDWNAEHVLTQASNRLLGRTTSGDGATEEISVGSGLTLSSGNLTLGTHTHPISDVTDLQSTLDGKFATTGGALTGNLTFSGSALRITGDFSNSTVANRLLFQNETVNASTILGVIPNGTGVSARVQFYNSSTPGSGTNSLLDFGVVGTTDVRLQSTYEASGTPLPLTIYTGGAERVRVDVSGNVGVGTNAPVSKFDLNGGAAQNVVAVAASAIDCSLGNVFTKTASGALTWTFTNVPASRMFTVILELTNGGTGVQSFTGVKWPGGTQPTLTASGIDVLGFITDDGGTTWRGVHLMKDSK